jgi:TRAP-type mannitol/chloroaromatic compound transport system permease large subunit
LRGFLSVAQSLRGETIYPAAVPYLIINLVLIGIILLFPKIALFLPNLLH